MVQKRNLCKSSKLLYFYNVSQPNHNFDPDFLRCHRSVDDQSGTKPKQVIKKITETSHFSFSLHQSKFVKFFFIKLKYAGFYIIKMLMGDAAR